MSNTTSNSNSGHSNQAYCVRCKKNTAAQRSQTVVLVNGSRALHGYCPDCKGEVYRILDKKSAAAEAKADQEKNENKKELKLSNGIYPDAYCVKCKTNTPALKGHTVILANDRRALRGICPNCQSEIYKILPKNNNKSTKISAGRESHPISLAVASYHPAGRAGLGDMASTQAARGLSNKSTWKQYLREASVIAGILVGLALSLWLFKI